MIRLSQVTLAPVHCSYRDRVNVLGLKVKAENNQQVDELNDGNFINLFLEEGAYGQQVDQGQPEGHISHAAGVTKYVESLVGADNHPNRPQVLLLLYQAHRIGLLGIGKVFAQVALAAGKRQLLPA